MERLVGVKQSLRLDGKKVCNIKMFDISQAESNNIKACALPSIHLPFFEGRQERIAIYATFCIIYTLFGMIYSFVVILVE